MRFPTYIRIRRERHVHVASISPLQALCGAAATKHAAAVTEVQVSGRIVCRDCRQLLAGMPFGGPVD